MRHRPAQRKQEQMGCSVVVPLGNTTIYCAEINYLMNNVIKPAATSKEKEAMPEHRFLREKLRASGHQLSWPTSRWGQRLRRTGNCPDAEEEYLV